jgi:capsular polysaccharide export protein
LALAQTVPVCTLGEAIYDIAGLTHQDHLDRFWTEPTPPEPLVYSAFRRVLVDRCLVRGGLASESAVQTLINSMLERLGCSAQTLQPALNDVEVAVPLRLAE